MKEETTPEKGSQIDPIIKQKTLHFLSSPNTLIRYLFLTEREVKVSMKENSYFIECPAIQQHEIYEAIDSDYFPDHCCKICVERGTQRAYCVCGICGARWDLISLIKRDMKCSRRNAQYALEQQFITYLKTHGNAPDENTVKGHEIINEILQKAISSIPPNESPYDFDTDDKQISILSLVEANVLKIFEDEIVKLMAEKIEFPIIFPHRYKNI